MTAPDMTTDDLQRLVDAATPGQRRVYVELDNDDNIDCYSMWAAIPGEQSMRPIGDFWTREDADLYVIAPDLVARENIALRARVMELEAERAAAALVSPGDGWRSMDSAPKGVSNGEKSGVSWMLLAIPDGEGGFHRVSGMRIGDKFYAALTFYCGGSRDSKEYEQREIEVNPTHWKPLPAPPASEGADHG